MFTLSHVHKQQVPPVCPAVHTHTHFPPTPDSSPSNTHTLRLHFFLSSISLSYKNRTETTPRQPLVYLLKLFSTSADAFIIIIIIMIRSKPLRFQIASDIMMLVLTGKQCDAAAYCFVTCGTHTHTHTSVAVFRSVNGNIKEHYSADITQPAACAVLNMSTVVLTCRPLFRMLFYCLLFYLISCF